MAKREELLARLQGMRLMHALQNKDPLSYISEMMTQFIGYVSAMPKGDKGDAGHTPTDAELLALIRPLIPPPLAGDQGDAGETPSNEKLLALIRPLIPPVKDGRTPTRDELLAIIRPLIPPAPVRGVDYADGLPGANGSPDTPNEILKKLLMLPDDELKRLFKFMPTTIVERQLPEISLFGSGGGGGSRLAFYDEGSPLGQDIQALDFIGAGVAATRLGTRVVVSIGGGAAGTNTTVEKLAGTQSGNDITLNLTQLSQTFSAILWVSRQGQIVTPTTSSGGGSTWTRSSNTITVTNAADDEDFLVAYTY